MSETKRPEYGEQFVNRVAVVAYLYGMLFGGPQPWWGKVLCAAAVYAGLEMVDRRHAANISDQRAR